MGFKIRYLQETTTTLKSPIGELNKDIVGKEQKIINDINNNTQNEAEQGSTDTNNIAAETNKSLTVSPDTAAFLTPDKQSTPPTPNDAMKNLEADARLAERNNNSRNGFQNRYSS